MKKILIIILGIIIVVIGFYFFLFCGLEDLIIQIKYNLTDVEKTVWAIMRLFPLFPVIVGIGFFILFLGCEWILEDN